jgi:NAD(P)-dependent dehydrogenase (short-subunit alcohol dehydrogenase family)
MIQRRKGKMINLSGGGATSPRPFFSAYSASKTAVVRLTETLAEEVAEFNIQVNTISPGAMNTRLLDEIARAGAAAGPKAMQEVTKQLQTGGTLMEKPAALALFLASEESDGLTGRVISAVWDDWKTIPQHLPDIMSSDMYTLRRIMPEDRGYNW